MFYVIGLIILLYMWVIMFPYAILSWFRIQPGTTLARLQYFLYRATEPVLRPVRQVIKPMGGLDWSFLVVILIGNILVFQVLWR
ncbi:MAG TPA: YggT family protein [Acidimicrobiales bacterium]